MRVVPKNKVPQIEFFETHVGKWAEAPEQIGTTAAEVAALADSTAAARAAFRQQRAAMQAAQAATLKLNLALADMNNKGASIILQIRTKAALAGDGVYPLASIPIPNAPSPIGPPGTPHSFSFSLDQEGVLRLKWKCQNPRGSVGTMYQVRRQVGGTGEFAFIGVAQTKSFIDKTLPVGVAAVIYQVRAIRSTAFGEVATFNVTFGTDGKLHPAMRFMGDDRQAA